MSRKKLIRTSKFAYHITTRSNNKEWFKLPLSLIWKLYIESFQFACSKVIVELHAFVLMSNHYHLLISTPNENIDIFMKYFNKRLSDKIKLHSNDINHKFGGRYKWCLISTKLYLYNVYKYIFQNPLKSKQVYKCEDYPYSSLYIELKKINIYPLEIINKLDHKQSELINWYNQSYSEFDRIGISRALCHSSFQVNHQRDIKKSIQLNIPLKLFNSAKGPVTF